MGLWLNVKLTSAGPEHDSAHLRRSSSPVAIEAKRRARIRAYWSKLELLSLPRRRRDRCCRRGARIGELQWDYVDGTLDGI